MESSIVFKPIGVIHSQHRIAAETPIQPLFAQDCSGQVEVFPEYEAGLKDIDGFSHLILLYHFDQAEECSLVVKPFLDDQMRGIFATRHPRRPNGIGLSIVSLVKREGRILQVQNIDILDNTPLLDIKPYVARFDALQDTSSGWMEAIRQEDTWQRGRRGFRGPADRPENG